MNIDGGQNYKSTVLEMDAEVIIYWGNVREPNHIPNSSCRKFLKKKKKNKQWNHNYIYTHIHIYAVKSHMCVCVFTPLYTNHICKNFIIWKYQVCFRNSNTLLVGYKIRTILKKWTWRDLLKLRMYTTSIRIITARIETYMSQCMTS